MPLAGDFQIANALVAAGLAISTGIHRRGCDGCARQKLQGAAGRLELVGQDAQGGALAYVDYAHKPDALENVLALRSVPSPPAASSSSSAAAATVTSGKRPIMGEIATRLADIAIVTDDNPRSEVPADHPRRNHGGRPPARPKSPTGPQAIQHRCCHAAGRRHADRGRQGPRRRPDGRRRDAAVLRPCRDSARRMSADDGERTAFDGTSALDLRLNFVAAMSGRPVGHLPEGITGISIDSRSIAQGRSLLRHQGRPRRRP